jgi:hypothetical protein
MVLAYAACSADVASAYVCESVVAALVAAQWLGGAMCAHTVHL